MVGTRISSSESISGHETRMSIKHLLPLAKRAETEVAAEGTGPRRDPARPDVAHRVDLYHNPAVTVLIQSTRLPAN